MVETVKITKIRNIVVFALLFFAAMNFKASFFYFVFSAFLAFSVLEGRLFINNQSFIYLALGVLMAVYNADEGILSMIRCFAPFCFYLVGLNLTIDSEKAPLELDYLQKQGYRVLAVISLGSFTHYVLNYLYNFNQQLGRNTNDIWSGLPMAATGQAALACLMLGLSVAMLYLPLKKWHRLGAVVAIALALLYNMILSGRTVVVILLLLLVVGFVYPKQGKNTTKLQDLFVILGLLAAVIGVFALNDENAENQANLIERFGTSFGDLISDGLRLEFKLPFLADMLKYPFGGLHLRDQYGYAHDLLLDGYDEYGVFGLGLLVAILITGSIQVYRALRYTSFRQEFKLALLLIEVALMMEFLVEPILAGMSWLFSCYCLTNGCITGMNRKYFKLEKRDVEVHR